MKNYINEVLIINTYHHIKFYGYFIFRFTNCIRTILLILSSKFVSHICCSRKSILHKYLQQQYMYTSIHIKTWTIKVELSRAARLPCVAYCWGPWVANFSDSRTTATRVKRRVELISERCKHGHKLHILLCEIPISCPNPRLYCHLTHLSKPKRTVS